MVARNLERQYRDPSIPKFHVLANCHRCRSMLSLHAIPPQFNIHNDSLSSRYYVAYRLQKGWSAVSHRGENTRTRPLVPSVKLPRVTTKGTCSHIIMLLTEAREDPIPGSHITSSRPQKLIISSCVPTHCVIFLSSGLSVVCLVFSSLLYVRTLRKKTYRYESGLLKIHFLIVKKK